MVDYVKKTDIREATEKNVSAETYEEVAAQVERLVEKAEERAEDNGRQTVMPRDV